MDNGIGRTGYRLLALVFLAVGALGLVLAWSGVPAPRENVLLIGAATAAAALAALFILALVLSSGRVATQASTPPSPSATAPTASDPPPFDPTDLDFEYGERPARTEPLSGDDEFHAVLHRADGSQADPGPDRDSRDWPVRTPKHGRPATQAPPSPEPHPTTARELADRYTADTPMVRSILSAAHEGPSQAHAPVRQVTAKQVEPGVRPGDAPSGTRMGRCGGCNTVLLAPMERPLRLRCPRCRRVTLLKE